MSTKPGVKPDTGTSCRQLDIDKLALLMAWDLHEYLGDDGDTFLGIAGAAGALAVGDRAKDLLEHEPFEDTGRYAALRQLAALTSHLEDPIPGSLPLRAREEACRETFLQQERTNAITNMWLTEVRHWFEGKPSTQLSSGRSYCGGYDQVLQVLRLARMILFKELGPIPDGVFDRLGFGPGATYTHAREACHRADKLASVGVTSQALPYWCQAVCRAQPAWLAALGFYGVYDSEGQLHLSPRRLERLVRSGKLPAIRIVPGDRFSSVPKNARTNRTITIGPSGNVGLQLAFASCLEVACLRLGVDVHNQAKSTAMIRSTQWDDGHLDVATLDEQNSSNSIVTALVRLIFPSDWFAAMDAIRSHTCDLKDGSGALQVHTYEMFSGMGNGFTFPLQSLIYASLARACAIHTGHDVAKVRVYGDDIIAPQGMALLLSEVIEFCGITVNRDKSFIVGPFRETCGLDILHGVNVRPVYLGSIPRSAPALAGFHNRLVMHPYFRHGFLRVSEYLVSLAHMPKFGPVDSGAWLYSEDEHDVRSYSKPIGARWFYSMTAPFAPMYHYIEVDGVRVGTDAYYCVQAYCRDGTGKRRKEQPPVAARVLCALSGRGFWVTQEPRFRVQEKVLLSQWYVPGDRVIPSHARPMRLAPGRESWIRSVTGYTQVV